MENLRCNKDGFLVPPRREKKAIIQIEHVRLQRCACISDATRTKDNDKIASTS